MYVPEEAIMPQWYYDKKDLKNTPSYLAGLESETETRYRREGARFIQEVGKTLNLRHDTMATASVYFHRFYMFHSFIEFPRYVSRLKMNTSKSLILSHVGYRNLHSVSVRQSRGDTKEMSGFDKNSPWSLK